VSGWGLCFLQRVRLIQLGEVGLLSLCSLVLQVVGVHPLVVPSFFDEVCMGYLVGSQNATRISRLGC
jgi:hypothetical protein